MISLVKTILESMSVGTDGRLDSSDSSQFELAVDFFRDIKTLFKNYDFYDYSIAMAPDDLHRNIIIDNLSPQMTTDLGSEMFALRDEYYNSGLKMKFPEEGIKGQIKWSIPLYAD
jgi:hypothetical protein